MAYGVILESEAREQFLSLDGAIRERIGKKLMQLCRDDLGARHLRHGSPHSVAEVGQHRIAYKIREDLKVKRVNFIGDHKQYEAWYREQE